MKEVVGESSIPLSIGHLASKAGGAEGKYQEALGLGLPDPLVAPEQEVVGWEKWWGEAQTEAALQDFH